MSFGMLDDSVDHIDNQVFNCVEQIFKVDERSFSFDVRELGQMSSCARRFGSVRLGNAENISQSGTFSRSQELKLNYKSWIELRT
jgi:hypothetical protein